MGVASARLGGREYMRDGSPVDRSPEPTGAGVPHDVTVTAPFIDGWMSQWYGYAPGLVNVTPKVLPTSRALESHARLSAVVVCLDGPLFVQSTVWPTFAVRA